MRANRIIKFRAWDGHKMIDDFLQVTENGRFIAHVSEGEDFTPLQFTGLLDKNGKEVCEGDKVKFHRFLFDGTEYESELIGTIKRGDYGWMLSDIENKSVNSYMGHDADGNEKGEAYLIYFYGMHEETFEIIGNIYETNLLTPQTR